MTILWSAAMETTSLKVVPATTTAREVLEHQPAGVFLSNGPGDPAVVDYAVRAAAVTCSRIGPDLPYAHELEQP